MSLPKQKLSSELIKLRRPRAKAAAIDAATPIPIVVNLFEGDESGNFRRDLEAVGAARGLRAQLALERRHTQLVLAESSPAPAELRIQAHERPVRRLLERVEGNQPKRCLHGLIERACTPFLGLCPSYAPARPTRAPSPRSAENRRHLDVAPPRHSCRGATSVDLVLLAAATIAYRAFRDGCVVLERDHAALVARKARAVMQYLDGAIGRRFQPGYEPADATLPRAMSPAVVLAQRPR